MNNTDIYIEKYKELEKAVRNAYGLNSLCSLTARNGYEVIFQLQQH